MATLKYKDGNEWKKVSIGGGGSTEEVYVGADAPTDDNVKVWIDPTGTPSGGNGGGSSGGSGSGTKIYVVPEGVLNATTDAPYTLTSEESEEFRSQGNFANTIVVIKTNMEGGVGVSYKYAREVLYLGVGILFSVEKHTYHTNGSALTAIQITRYEIAIGDFGSGEIMGETSVSSGKINL